MTLINDTHCNPLSGEHMKLNSTETALGSVVNITCDDGYETIGRSVLHCRDFVGWSSGVPVCHKTQGISPMIVAVTTAATIIALAVLIIVAYMLLKNCKRGKSNNKMSEKAFEHKMRDISEYFSVTPDCVGMPAMLCKNWDEKIRGRSLSSTSLINRKKNTEGATDLADHFEDQNEKELIY